MRKLNKYVNRYTDKTVQVVSHSYTYQRKLANMMTSTSLTPTAFFTSTAFLTSTAFKPIITLFIMGMSSVSVHAAILSDNNERRVQVRQSSSNAYIKPATTVNKTVIPMLTNNTFSSDSMQGLIEQKQRQFDFDAKLSIEESKRVNTKTRPSVYNPIYNTTYDPVYSTNSNSNSYGNAAIDFNSWLNSNRYRAQQIANYQRFLSSQIGAQNVPPMEQLLTTARSWDKCGYEPYQLPPQELWANIVPTLRLYSNLKNQGILPASTEIRSVYRDAGLNNCAGGANSSKHMTAGAIDIWVPEYENDQWRLNSVQDGLCQFWQYQGVIHGFGLGLYATGAIHLDTQGYRKWGFEHASRGSACRS